jgi:hypothetical protein
MLTIEFSVAIYGNAGKTVQIKKIAGRSEDFVVQMTERGLSDLQYW